MTSKAIDALEGIIVMLVFIPILFTFDGVMFSVLESTSGLPFASLLLVVIALVEITGYVRFFRGLLGI